MPTLIKLVDLTLEETFYNIGILPEGEGIELHNVSPFELNKMVEKYKDQDSYLVDFKQDSYFWRSGFKDNGEKYEVHVNKIKGDFK